jgi:hypothetical protein
VYKFRRRHIITTLQGGYLFLEIANFVKYAPSACNTQPWRVICKNNTLKVYRTTEVKSIMPKEKVPFYNSIDMGIFLYFLELILSHNEFSFQRTLSSENNHSNLIPIATYVLE